MKCNSCNSSIRPGSNFCHSCGEPIIHTDYGNRLIDEVIQEGEGKSRKPKVPRVVGIATMIAVYLLVVQIYAVYSYRETINLFGGIASILLLIAIYVGIRRRIFYAPIVGALFVSIDLISDVFLIIGNSSSSTLSWITYLPQCVVGIVVRIFEIYFLIRAGLWMKKNGTEAEEPTEP